MATVIPARYPGDFELVISGGTPVPYNDIDGYYEYNEYGPFLEANDGSLLHLNPQLDDGGATPAGAGYVARASRSGDDFTYVDTDISSGVAPLGESGRLSCSLGDGRILVVGSGPSAGSETCVLEMNGGVAEWGTLVDTDPQIWTGHEWWSGLVALDDTHAVVIGYAETTHTLGTTLRPRLQFINAEVGMDPDTAFTGLTIGTTSQAGGLDGDNPLLIKISPTRVLAAWRDWTTDIYQESTPAKHKQVLYCQLVDVNVGTGGFTVASDVTRFELGFAPTNQYFTPTWHPSPDGDGGVLVITSSDGGGSPAYTGRRELVARSLVVTGNTISEGHSGLVLARSHLEPTEAGDTEADMLLSEWYGYAAMGVGDRGAVIWSGVDFGTAVDWIVGDIPIHYTKFLVDTYPPRKGGLRAYATGELTPSTSTSAGMGGYSPSTPLVGGGGSVAVLNQWFDDFDSITKWFVIAREPT